MLRQIVKKIPGARQAYRYINGLRYKGRGPEAVFSGIFQSNEWHGEDSVSGTGSDLTQTAVVRDLLPRLFAELEVKTVLDVPCGDFNWMRHVDLSAVHYTGADIVSELVDANARRYGNETRKFERVDLIAGPVPRADLVFCRDCLVHLSYNDGMRALANIAASGSRYLLSTTFPGVRNRDIVTGQWRPLDLEAAPFNLLAPLRVVSEQCTEPGDFSARKALGLWALTVPRQP